MITNKYWIDWDLFLYFPVVITEILVKPSLADCPALRAPFNGYLDRSCGTRVGNICRIYCRKNCQLVGDRVHRCLSNNTWSGSPTFCIDKNIRCRPPLNPPNNGYQVGNCYNKVGCVCRFACNTGYTIVGSPQVVCQRSGQWSPRPTCVITTTTTTGTSTCDTTTDSGDETQAYCPALEVPTNGQLLGSCGVSPPQSICRFRCNNGYLLIGNYIRVCQTSGEWTDNTVRCIRVPTKCPPIRPPRNGAVYGYCSPGISGFKCNFVCNSGYIMVGLSSLTCQTNGAWSSAAPVCNAI